MGPLNAVPISTADLCDETRALSAATRLTIRKARAACAQDWTAILHSLRALDASRELLRRVEDFARRDGPYERLDGSEGVAMSEKSVAPA